jgi:hypothetical protein
MKMHGSILSLNPIAWTVGKFSPKVRDRAVRMLLDHEREHPSRWAAIISLAAKIGGTGQTLSAEASAIEFLAQRASTTPKSGFPALVDTADCESAYHATMCVNSKRKLGTP